MACVSKGRFVPSEPIITTGEILRIYSERAFEAKLPNGKKVIAHPAKALAPQVDRIVPGARVRLEMTPFDFEKARIAGIVSLD
jgi:translation initiation factor IF-1